VDWLTELGAHSEDTTWLLTVGAFLLGIENTLRSDNKIFDGQVGMSLLGHHDTIGEEEAVEGSWLHAELFHRPLTSEVGPDIVGIAKSRTSYEADIAMLTNRTIS
jgi:hypothetical protein